MVQIIWPVNTRLDLIHFGRSWLFMRSVNALDLQHFDRSWALFWEPVNISIHHLCCLYLYDYIIAVFQYFSGTPINKAPSLSGKDINLYRLYKIVQNLGGYNKVTLLFYTII